MKGIAKEGDTYGDPAPFVETKTQPSDVASDAAGRIYVSQNAEPGLAVVDADGKSVATLDKWGEASTREIAGMAMDRAGCLVCGLGNRGKIIRIPLSEIFKLKS